VAAGYIIPAGGLLKYTTVTAWPRTAHCPNEMTSQVHQTPSRLTSDTKHIPTTWRRTCIAWSYRATLALNTFVTTLLIS